MSRLRTRSTIPVNWKIYSSSGTVTSSGTGGGTCESFFEGTYPGSNNCLHWTLKPMGAYKWTYPNGGYQTVSSGDVLPYSDIERYVRKSVPFISLNREKLLTTSQFGLLQALAELDDTIALFSAKALKEFSYGTFTWGVLPFVSDVQAISQQANNLARRANQNYQPYEDELSSSLSGSEPATVWGRTFDCNYQLQATSRLSGSVTIPELPILELYDRLGFHPDVATAWDLVPLSFLVDYVIPVGDYLEAVSNRGWIKAVNFTGWKTTHIKGSITLTRCTAGPSGEVGGYYSDLKQEFEFFSRSKLLASVLLDEDDPLPSLLPKAPSIKQAFNMLYVGLARK